MVDFREVCYFANKNHLQITTKLYNVFGFLSIKKHNQSHFCAVSQQQT